MNSIGVYLAGGFHSGWQNLIIEGLTAPDIVFLDPRNFDTPKPNDTRTRREVFSVDVDWIKKCDLMIVNLERDNPGKNCIWEAGFAKGLGKPVIAVYEYHNLDDERYHFFVALGADSAFRVEDYDDFEAAVAEAIVAAEHHINNIRETLEQPEVGPQCAERRYDTV